ncbi:hypothetical protein B566_EDAN009332 [Ephemera danica]|nr:hypothetical protein B566_EDAN009332 [Ephemera danica]
MSRSRIILVSAVFLLLLTLATTAPGPRKLPPGLIPCSLSLPNLEECIMENAIKGVPIVAKGQTPVLQLIGEYETSGRVLILPITGKGPMNFTLENVDFKYTFDWKKDKVRQGRDYVTAKNFKLTFETSRCHIQMDNLFNGDKRLSDSMNAFLNENWREMVEDLGPTIGEALNQGFQQIILTILDQVPFDSFFPLN